ncbi:hydroxysqualene dehydroxylase [Actinospongicola halichondriae]|uniref:hydroxysqualene dehydroxylase n=1 Tax=Actinospongicola halichondriae TaxID=3236844 RepID=UPI003D39B804
MRVAVLGGGVAGLSAAMELLERGIAVDVYEALDIPGGKARSMVIERPSQAGLPSEHGFRFFPGFYRHVIDTMKRIPTVGGKSVADNLVAADYGMFARAGQDPIVVPAISPRSLHDVIDTLHNLRGITKDLSTADIEFFAGKLWQIMTSCGDRRLEEYEDQSWADFIEAEDRSSGYQEWFAGAMTRTLIAASGNKASARTVGDITIQILLSSWKPGGQSDRLLDGPTNEVWIDPWMDYLRLRGVRFFPGHRVQEILLGDSEIEGIRVENDTGDRTITADHYILAMPVEAVAALVTDELADAVPSLATTRELTDRVAWMSGMQIYLRKDTEIVRGHSIYVGSAWGLTSISQQQFWPHHRLSADSGGRVNGVLSVDISDWDSPGSNGKTARECTLEEIRTEVLGQLRACVGHLPGVDLSDANVDSFFIDPDIVFFGADGTAEANHEPLFVNERGTWWLRPHAHTELPNLYLASDYVRTNTDLATMEGANEAARRAVNAILGREGMKARRCHVWSLHEPWALTPLRWMDQRRFARGEPWSSEIPDVFGRLAHVIHRGPRR